MWFTAPARPRSTGSTPSRARTAGVPAYAMGGYSMGLWADMGAWVLIAGDLNDLNEENYGSLILYYSGAAETPPEYWEAFRGSAPAPVVTPVAQQPTVSYYCADAGTAAVNGHYTNTGETNGGYPVYAMGDYCLGVDSTGPAWVFIEGGTDNLDGCEPLYYVSPLATDTPPESGWDALASAPPPTVYEIPDAGASSGDEFNWDTNDMYMVIGAGAEEVNGVYTNCGVFYNDHPVYIMGEYTLGYRSGSWGEFWVIVGGDDYTRLEAEQSYCPYYATWGTAGDTPPSSGWQVNIGVAPAPTVIAYGPVVLYSGDSFSESAADDGSVTDTLTITYLVPEGDSFSGANGTFDTSKYISANVPDGLAVAIIRNSDTELSVALAGTASAHHSAESIADMRIVLLDAAFAGADASGIRGTTNSSLAVTFRSSDQFGVGTDTSNSKSYTKTAALADGGFVVIWGSFGQDGDNYGVYGRRFAADGSAAGDEFLVNTYTSGGQQDPAVAALADGGFLVTWYSYEGDSGMGVYGQRYAADGSASGGEFLLSAASYYQSMAGFAGGGYVAAWQSTGDGDGYGIFGQRYDAAGIAAGAKFQVNTYTNSNQGNPSVAVFTNGGFVATWTSVGQDGNGDGIYGQRFAADGSAVGEEFQVNTITNGNQQYSSVAVLSGGGFVVAYYDRATGVFYGQRYAADGSAAGEEFVVDDAPSGWGMFPSVAALADGGFIVTYSGQMKRFAADGTQVGEKITYVDSCNYPSVSVLACGTPVVAWEADNDVYARVGLPIFSCGTVALEVETDSLAVDIDTLVKAYNLFGGDLTWSVVSNATHGTLSGLPDTQTSVSGTAASPDGSTYHPYTGFAGSDSFTIQVASEFGGTDLLTVSVTVTGTASGPALSGVTGTDGKFVLSWPASYGNSFNVLTNGNLQSGSWGICEDAVSLSGDNYVVTNRIEGIDKLFFKIQSK